METEKFNLENLKPLIGQKFVAKNEEGDSVTLTLTQVKEYDVKGVETESFTATFSNEKGALAEDGLYIIEHASIGECHLCISLNSLEECEVVVSRLKTPIEPPQTPTAE